MTPLVWPRPQDDYDSLQTIGGVNYLIRGGKVYNRNGLGPALQTLYSSTFVSSNFSTEKNITYRRDSTTGLFYPVFKVLNESFLTAQDLKGLIGTDKNFNSCTLQSPLANAVNTYVALRQNILASTATFLDNRIDVITSSSIRSSESQNRKTPDYDESGSFFTANKLLRLLAVGKGQTSITKTSLDNELLFFFKGELVTTEVVFLIEEGSPTGLYDIESAYIVGGPGLRVLFDNLTPYVELKWGDKPTYYQASPRTSLKLNEWYKIKTEYLLSDTNGTVKLWINDNLVINQTGQTLPTPDAVYTRIGFGIPANSTANNCIVYVDTLNIY